MRPIFRATSLAMGSSLFLSAASSLAQDKPAAFPTNEQMRHLRAIGDPKLSPDGHEVLVRITDATADGGKTHLWMVDVEGGGSRQLTYSPDSDKRGERNGEWMPDGKSILFVAKRGEHTQLFRLPMAGGEAKPFDLKVTPVVDESKLLNAVPPVTKPAKPEEDKAEPIVIDVAAFLASPDGKTIAILANDPQTPGEKKQKDAKADADWVDHDPHGSRMYLLDVASSKLTSVGVAPDVRGATWTHDSAKLAVLAEGPNGASELGPANSAWLVSASDPAHAEKLTEIPATVEAMTWSQDGGTLVYTAQAKQDAPPGVADLYIDTLATKATRNLTDGMAASLGRGEPITLAGGGIVVLVEKGTDTVLARYGTSATPEWMALPVPVVAAIATNETHSGWVFLGSGGGRPTTLYYSAKLDGTPKALTLPTLAPEGLKTVVPKRIQWTNEKMTVDGLLFLPPQAAAGKVPLIVEVHGGPTGAYVDSYAPWVDFLLGQGWAVLRTNPRGSTGRGAGFAAANKNDLGGADYRDVMAGVDFVLKTEPIDVDRMALMGYSYGGEMAGFVEGKTTRFKAVISGAPVIDQNSEYGTERGSWYDRWFYGLPWEHQSDAWRQSPLSGIAHAKTPFMLLQGESDSTDPLGQSQEMYRALKQMRVPVELVTYPRDDHGALGGAIYGTPTVEPWHGFDARQRIVTFLEKAFNATKP